MSGAAAKPARVAKPSLGQRFKQHILHGYFVRIHMSLILAAVTVSGVLTSKLLLLAGVRSLRFRYPLAVIAAYLVFLGLVRVWIWYVARRQAAASGLGLGNLNFSGSGGGGGSVDLPGIGGGGAPFRFGGGDAGGGGASSSWIMEADAAALPPPDMPVVGSGSGGGGGFLRGFSLPDLDLGDDGWEILLLLALLVLAILFAGGYLIYAAPEILPEAAWQAVLASTLARAAKQGNHNWMAGVCKSTAIPAVIVLILATSLGWVSHNYCPEAAKLMDVLRCAAP